MADIKTRQVNKGSIKSIDRAANLSGHVRSATVKTKDGISRSTSRDDRSESAYASDNTMQMAERTVRGSSRILVGGSRKAYRNVSTKREMIDVKTKRRMVHRSANRSAKSVASAARIGREQSAKVASVARAKKIKIAGKAATVKSIQQAKKIEQARKAQLVARKTAERTAKETKRVTILAFRAVKKVIESAAALISAISAGGIVSVVIIVICVMFGAAFYFFGDESSKNYTPVSAEVEAYTPLIQKYANQYGIGEYTELIKAVMMQESGGRGTDPMQCSESPYNTKYSKAPGSIKDPEYSIDCGVHYLADCLSSAKCKNPLDMERIRLALQGYNYGNGYISWAIKRDGGYTVENASVFSDEQAKKHGWSGYGDKQYPAHVLRYYPYGSYNIGVGNGVIVQVAAQQIGNHGGKKFWSWYGFSGRVEWCACYVSWCADQCGYIKSGTIPKFAGVGDGVDWFKERGQFQRNTYKPAPGDIIFFDWGADGTRDHVGIVEKCDGRYVYTIEGNTSDMCARRTYSVGSSQIYGYGVPKY